MLNTLTLHEVLGKLDRHECRSVDVVESVLDAIARVDAQIHGYLTVDGEAALAQAKAADDARSQGKAGRLLGVPLAVKCYFPSTGRSAVHSLATL